MMLNRITIFISLLVFSIFLYIRGHVVIW